MSDEPDVKRLRTEGDEEAVYRKAIEDVDAVQRKIDEINERASSEILKVEEKFNGIRKPVYAERSEIIKTIKNFWPTTLINHPSLGTFINEHEETLLMKIVNIELEEFEETGKGWRAKFFFNPENIYFSNEVIVKEFFLSGDHPHSTVTHPDWKTKEGKTDGDGKMSLNDVIGPRSRSENMSFFEWLFDEGDPSADEIAEVLREDVWVNPMTYYLSPDAEEVDFEGEEDGDGDAE